MAGLTTKVLMAFLVCLVVMTLCTESKEQQPRKLKKYNPAVDSAPAVKKSYRSPRQAGSAERRQYYPCISCFKVGSREICTSPFCPENYQCDKASKRCHKKANIRGRPEPAAEEPAEPPAEN